jgi:hypothetical protein
MQEILGIGLSLEITLGKITISPRGAEIWEDREEREISRDIAFVFLQLDNNGP